MIKQIDLPLFKEWLDHLGIGGARWLKRMGYGHTILGLCDEPGIWKRTNKERPFTTKKELM